MRALLHTEFTALLARADISQAAFARLAGVTPRQVNNWARGRAAVPRWAGLLVVVLEEFTPEALDIMVEEAASSWHEILGISPEADAITAPAPHDPAGPPPPPRQGWPARADDPRPRRLRRRLRQPG